MFRRMVVIPVIELRDGGAVRPSAGSTGAAPGTPAEAERAGTRDNPFETVRAWSAAGFHRIREKSLNKKPSGHRHAQGIGF